MRIKNNIRLLMGLLAVLPGLAHASAIDGSQLSVWWGIPFAGMLLSIAFVPLLAPRFWHHHFGKVVIGWSLAFLVPCIVFLSPATATEGLMHALTAEYIPFIILLTSLFVVAGGICVRGNLHGTPALNTGLLLMGTLLASIMGTTGASMLMIRPLIRANDNRKHVIHVIVFFIFLVSNMGGSLTPLGDPPLFLGFLKGIDFFWTMKNIFPETLFVCGVLLIIFYFLDRHYYHIGQEELPAIQDPTPDSAIRLEGKVNFVLLVAIIAAVLMSGFWKSGISFSAFGAHIDLQNALRDLLLVGVTLISLGITPKTARTGNDFSWGPMQEVAKLFAGIFITIIPVIAMLKAGEAGVFSAVVRAVTDTNGEPINAMYFWATGFLSAFLDNAPTYLVFFNIAGGDVAQLMTTMGSTLAAISCGAVFMGAGSYIGNAPNMMVKAIAEDRGIKMPSFFGYMAWSTLILVPLFGLTTLIFFR